MTATYERAICEGIVGSIRRFLVDCGHEVERGEEVIHCYQNGETDRVSRCSSCGRAWIKARAARTVGRRRRS